MTVCYLTEVRVPYSIAARSWKDGGFRDSYSWHRRIWEAFPNDGRATRDFLSRLDDTGEDFRLLILSKTAPTKPDWCPDEGWRSKPVENSFFQKNVYRFSLLANPTVKKRSNADGELLKNSRRVPITDRDGLIEWLERKGSQHGFQVDRDTLKTIPRSRQTFVKKGVAGRHAATEFSGVLTVNNQERFQQACLSGVGPAKAFGFGLLCLAPISNEQT